MYPSLRFRLPIVFSLMLSLIVSLVLFTSTRGMTYAAGTSLNLSRISDKSSTQPQLKCGRWHVVPSPPGANQILFGVAATSTNDAWSVGYMNNGTADETFIEHWDGTSWGIVPSPNPGSNSNLLRAVTSMSTDDAWVVGSAGYSDNGQTLIEHWDGTSWSVVPSPNAGIDNDLNGVIALSPSDVWAVGFFYNGTADETFIEHWDGTSWGIVPSPSPNEYNYLRGVTAISPTDIWAVGDTIPNNSKGVQTLIEHWDGTSWSVVPSPNPDPQDNLLFGITQVPGTNQLWAVGSYNNKTLTEYWDGTSWSVVPSPNPTLKDNILEGVAALSPSDVWAVGFYGPDKLLIEHWDGTSWTITAQSVKHRVLFGVAQVPGTSQAWTVGEMYGTTQGTLIEFYC